MAINLKDLPGEGASPLAQAFYGLHRTLPSRPVAPTTREASIQIDDNDVGYMCACCGGRPAGKMARLHDDGALICRGCIEAALTKLDGG